MAFRNAMAMAHSIKAALLTLALLSQPGAAQMSQPFTYAELYQVFKHLATPKEAEEMAQMAVGNTNYHGPTHEGQGLAYRSTANVTLTDDTLVLLSLLSPEVEAKVEAYRREMRGGQPELPAEAEAWQNRRRELKAWADAGYPTSESRE